MSENKQRIVGIVVLAAFIALLVPFLFNGGENRRGDSLEYGKEIELQLGDNNMSVGAPSPHVNQLSSEQLTSSKSDDMLPTTSIAMRQEDTVSPEVQNNSNDTKLSGDEQSSTLTSSMDIKKIEPSGEISLDSIANESDVANNTVRNTKRLPVKTVTTKKVVKKAASKRTENNVESWSVQVGSFSDHNRVQALSDKLQANGFLVYLQKIETTQGPMTRVLVGKEKSREEAVRVAKRLKNRLKVNGSIVANRL